jgi:zinc/manganese transport system substrate-binding protein
MKQTPSLLARWCRRDRWSVPLPVLALLPLLLLWVGGCGSSSSQRAESTATSGAVGTATVEMSGSAMTASRPTIVVTTNILGDVVAELVGDQVHVVTLMPRGVDPHNFSLSAKEVEVMRSADALVVNGAGFEEGLVDVIEATEAAGIPTFEAISAVPTLDLGHAGAQGHEAADEHAEEDEHGHPETGIDPHFFGDPMRMALVVDALREFLTESVPGIDPEALTASVAEYRRKLEALDAELTAMLEPIPPAHRKLVTNHEVLSYFADRYGFEIIGTVIPSGTTGQDASARDLKGLADLIEQEQVPAIFADVTASERLAQALAAEVGRDIAVVELFSESLAGPGSGAESYLQMMRTNGQRIADALR